MTRKIIVSLFTAVLLSGCSLSELQGPQIEEGVLTKVSMDFNAGTSQVYTRAAQSSGSEFYVENLYILIFDNKDGHKRLMTTDDRGNTLAFFTETAGLTVTQGNQSSPTNGSVAFNVPSASSATVIAIANVGIPATRYSLTKEQLDGISTLDELKSLVVKVDNTISRGNRFLMAGYGENQDGSNDIVISNDNGSTNICNITLKRVDAKIEVDITCVPSGKNWTGMSFSPKNWKIVNVPQQSRLLPYTKDGIAGPWEDTDEGTMNVWDASTGPDGSQASYYQTSEYEFETEATYEEDNTVYSKGGGFTFYMPENRKRFKKSSATYADRDKFEGSNPVNANDYSTYMVLTGFLTYKDNGTNQTVNADARYIVHLGGLSLSSFDDYDTKQNGHYKYSITIKGIDNIVTEVTNDNEVRPGYEGDVVYSTETFELDAHYETRLLEIPVNADFDKMTWSVWTHFSSGTYNGGNDYTNIQDYKWIKFAFNSHFGTSPGEFVRFPGIIHYDATRTAEELAQAVEDGEKPLFDIDQLIKYLQYIDDPSSLVATRADDHICITAFVDEYIYLSDPETGGQDNLLFWKECVDTDDRQLHILSGDRNVSTDGNSSVTKALYTFRQKSIRTVYNKDAPDLQTAWGLETVIEQAVADETDSDYQPGNRLLPGEAALSNISGSSDNRNGRKNTVNIIGSDTPWNEIVDHTNNTLKGDYQSAAYACMLRNRDEDGNGVIDESEIKWYLAAIDQLTDIYIGEWALNTAARLYPDNPNNRPGGNGPYWHYTSSSYNSEEGAPWVLWAEEGASRGSYSESNRYDRNRGYYSYRCIRNLGIAVTNVEHDPDPLITIKNTGSNDLGPYTFDLSRVNPKSIRSSKIENNSFHHNNESDNRPYLAFSMDPGTYPEPDLGEPGLYWEYLFNNALSWQSYQTYNPCPNGYRAPNLRELLIMSSLLPDNAWETFTENKLWDPRVEKAVYVSFTSFALENEYSNYNERYGFLWQAQSQKITLLQADHRDEEYGYVRCIKDIDPQQ